MGSFKAEHDDCQHVLIELDGMFVLPVIHIQTRATQVIPGADMREAQLCGCCLDRVAFDVFQVGLIWPGHTGLDERQILSVLLAIVGEDRINLGVSCIVLFNSSCNMTAARDPSSHQLECKLPEFSSSHKPSRAGWIRSSPHNLGSKQGPAANQSRSAVCFALETGTPP